jgi:hypothetical protein
MSEINVESVKNDAVVESDFSYQAPDNTPDENFDADARNAIESIAQEFESGTFDDADSNVDDSDSNNDNESSNEEESTEEAVEDNNNQENLEQEDEKFSKSVDKYLQRELAAKEKENRALETEKRAKSYVDELKTLRAEVSKYKDAADFKDRIEIDPAGAIRSLGLDPSYIIRLSLAQELGDGAPEALKSLVSNTNEKREVRLLRSEREEEKKVLAARQYFDTVSNGAREWINKAGESTPALASVNKEDADFLHSEIMEVISADANNRAVSDPLGEPMSYKDAYTIVETRGKRLAALFGTKVQNADTNKGTQPGKKPTTAPPKTKPAAKPITKPSAPWIKNRSSDLEKQGIDEAIREYNRLESARKAARK